MAILLLLCALSCRRESTPTTSIDAPAGAMPDTAPARTAAEIFHNCQLCHSTREMQRGPILDGLPAWMVELQLRKFRGGIRGRNEDNKSELLMGAGESILQDEDEIRRVAAYIAGLPSQRHLLTLRGNAERGGRLYESQCAACHGEQGEGKPEVKGTPLTTLEDWYLMDQLRKFKRGLRGTHRLDAEGQVMRATMAPLNEEDFKDIVRYIAGVLGEGIPPRETPRKQTPSQP